MRNLVARCLQKDHKQRPSARELLEDKFFKVRVAMQYTSLWLGWD
jgi:serine/threonine protein kinase